MFLFFRQIVTHACEIFALNWNNSWSGQENDKSNVTEIQNQKTASGAKTTEGHFKFKTWCLKFVKLVRLVEIHKLDSAFLHFVMFSPPYEFISNCRIIKSDNFAGNLLQDFLWTTSSRILKLDIEVLFSQTHWNEPFKQARSCSRLIWTCVVVVPLTPGRLYQLSACALF